MGGRGPGGLWSPPPRRSGMSEDIARREKALASAPLFADIPKRHLRSIAKLTAVPSFEPGSTIVKEGSTGSLFFVILEGSAKVLQGGKAIGRLKPGDYFGEISLLDPGPRTATVVAVERTTCLNLAGADFRDILAHEPKLALNVMRVLARRVRSSQPATVSA
jgi:CRP/FNR family transcriptional regulator, cyclic AMP receptor protein